MAEFQASILGFIWCLELFVLLPRDVMLARYMQRSDSLCSSVTSQILVQPEIKQVAKAIISDFRIKPISIISETMQHTAIVTWKATYNRNSYALYRILLFPLTASD